MTKASEFKRYVKYVRGFFPEALPLNYEWMKNFTDDILFTYSLPDMPSYRQAIGTVVMHLGQQTNHKSKYFFAKTVRKAISNQLAYEMLQELKEAQKLQAVPPVEPA